VNNFIINIFDKTFIKSSNSSTGKKSPESFSYVIGEEDFDGITIYTDRRFHKAKTTKANFKIAWQVESPAFSRPPRNPEDFDQIWTYNESLIEKNPQLYKRANFGGTRVENPTMFEKSKDICIVHSGKRRTHKHLLRKKVINQLEVDSFGRGTKRPFKKIEDVYKDYRFVIVIENIIHRNYFSEKLTDAIACGCIPIYCGSKHNAESFFPGLTRFKNIKQLRNLLPTLTPEYYEANKPTEHIETVRRDFYTTEDWLVRNYYEKG